VESDDSELYQHFLEQFKQQIGTEWISIINRQDALIDRLFALQNEISQMNIPRQKKIMKLREKLARDYSDLAAFPPLPLPINPSILAVGIASEDAYIFKSAMQPFGISFKTNNGSQFKVL
jgi:phosphatidylinositol 3-kinase